VGHSRAGLNTTPISHPSVGLKTCNLAQFALTLRNADLQCSMLLLLMSHLHLQTPASSPSLPMTAASAAVAPPTCPVLPPHVRATGLTPMVPCYPVGPRVSLVADDTISTPSIVPTSLPASHTGHRPATTVISAARLCTRHCHHYTHTTPSKHVLYLLHSATACLFAPGLLCAHTGPGLACLPLNPSCTKKCLGVTYCKGGAGAWVDSPSADNQCGAAWQQRLCIVDTKSSSTHFCNGGWQPDVGPQQDDGQ
jgi:hypothetical protein